MIPQNLEKILLDVQKPSQYIGGELNSVVKEKEQVDIRLAFCFPPGDENTVFPVQPKEKLVV